MVTSTNNYTLENQKTLIFFLRFLWLIKVSFNYAKFDNFFFSKLRFFFKKNFTNRGNLGHVSVFKSRFELSTEKSELGRGYSVVLNTKNTTNKFNMIFYYRILYLNMWLPTPNISTHPSFNSFYFFNKYQNIGCFNFKKVFNLWVNIFTFVSNIFFYNLKYLAFGNSYFKYEVLSINWYSTNFSQAIWKYVGSFVFFLNNKTTLRNKRYFYFLTSLGYRLAFVADIYYHSKTIYYLNHFKYISVGPIPLSSNFYLLTITIPTSSNFLFSNLFFLRFIIKLKKDVTKNTHTELYNLAISAE